MGLHQTLIIEVDDYKAAVELVKQSQGTFLKIGEPYEGVRYTMLK
jgi:hypothetical protein